MPEKMNEAAEQPELIALEDEDGNVSTFEYLETVIAGGKPYAVLLPTEEDDDAGVVIVEVIDLGLESERYDAVTDEKICEDVFEQFRKEFGEKYDFE